MVVTGAGRRARGTAFGTSALEESDVYGGELEDYADDADPHAGMHFEVVSSDEDASGGGRGRGDSPKRVEGSAATVLLKARQGTMGRDSFIEGYVRGAMQQPQAVESTPVPPRCRAASHRFEQPCSKLYGALRQQPAGPASTAAASTSAAAASTAPVPVPPPADRELKQRIDLAAASVARGGNEMLEFLQKSHAGATRDAVVLCSAAMHSAIECISTDFHFRVVQYLLQPKARQRGKPPGAQCK